MTALHDIQFWKLILLGGMTGVFSGLFGIGGGIVLVPILVYFFSFSQTAASATSLIAIALLPVGSLGVYQYFKAGIINADHFRFGLWMSLGIFMGGYFGAKLGTILPVSIMQKAFSLLMVVGAYRLWMSSLVK